MFDDLRDFKMKGFNPLMKKCDQERLIEPMIHHKFEELMIQNVDILVKTCKVDTLKILLVEKGVFTSSKIEDLFSGNDGSSNTKNFFTLIQKDKNSWSPFIQCLKLSGQSCIADIFLKTDIKTFNPYISDEEPEESFIPDPNPSTTPLNDTQSDRSSDALREATVIIPPTSNINQIEENISEESVSTDSLYSHLHGGEVIKSKKFYDTVEHNGIIDFYKSRSKTRGRVLIINNHFKSGNFKFPRRRGAEIDDEYLKTLFSELGGWNVNYYTDLTISELKKTVENFSSDEINVSYDICFVIIMGHGGYEQNHTIIYGVDEDSTGISVFSIEKLFSNKNCKSLRTKPKVLIFSVCRGENLQYPIQFKFQTETDAGVFGFLNRKKNIVKFGIEDEYHSYEDDFLRPEEDMLVCYATVPGYSSFRNTIQGSWYIELIYQVFTKHAHNQSVDDLMLLVDQYMRKRKSFMSSGISAMQTSEFINKGFKKLYLHPGLYCEANIAKKHFFLKNSSVKDRVNTVFPGLINSDSKTITVKTPTVSITPSESNPIRKPGLYGLKNIGNTCFMNSIIQCLSNTKALTDFIKKNIYRRYIASRTGETLIGAFADVIKELWTEYTIDKVVDTTSLKNQIQLVAPQFEDYAQQDAHEFLKYLLQGLHEDVNRVNEEARLILQTPDDETLSDYDKGQEAWKMYLTRENSVLVDHFVGQLQSTLECTSCGYCSVTFSPFWDLSLPIPQVIAQPANLSQCLDCFIREETLDGDEQPVCSNCKVRRKCTKRFSISKFPKILVIHLKRFAAVEGSQEKLNMIVDFPLEGLDMNQYSSDYLRGCKYNLYAVSNHSGSASSGHYTACCRHSCTGQWHEYNDTNVTPVSSEILVSEKAYVLFYEKEN